MSDTEKINQQNHAYWTDRASGYSEVNQEELAGIQKKTWSDLLDREIRDHFKIGETHRSRIRILDIGAGPGFLSVILCEQGYQVTAADYAETMLEEAKQNAGTLAEKICFRREDAMNLSFPKATFDVVLSRNLTWNLPDPQRAYEEWLRVLKHNGLLLIFDANWHLPYLTPESRADMRARTENTIRTFGSDFSGHTTIESLGDPEAPAHPKEDYRILRDFLRPDWDIGMLSTLGYKDISYDRDITGPLWDDKEKMMYGNTPMFMIRAVK